MHIKLQLRNKSPSLRIIEQACRILRPASTKHGDSPKIVALRKSLTLQRPGVPRTTARKRTVTTTAAPPITRESGQPRARPDWKLRKKQWGDQGQNRYFFIAQRCVEFWVPSFLSSLIFVELQPIDRFSGMLRECVPCHLLVLLFILEKRLWHGCWAFSRSAYPKPSCWTSHANLSRYTKVSPVKVCLLNPDILHHLMDQRHRLYHCFSWPGTWVHADRKDASSDFDFQSSLRNYSWWPYLLNH